jgi:hypothetical protein
MDTARDNQQLSPGIVAASETAASFLLDAGFVERWVEGAIFPSEMAFFLAVCTAKNIEAVVESGRQDGYSTEILGRWGQGRNFTISSIDLEEEHERAQACRARLKSLPVDLVRGNAYSEVGRQARGLQGRRTALLMDGPKGWQALSLMAASAAESHVEVMALHNLHDGYAERAWFQAHGGWFYEDIVTAGGPRWQELRRRETAHGQRDGALRSLEISSLGVVVLDEQRRKSLSSSFQWTFGLHQPAMVRAFWRAGAYALTPKLYGLSYRTLGR